jgi:hypothetical protein
MGNLKKGDDDNDDNDVNLDGARGYQKARGVMM